MKKINLNLVVNLLCSDNPFSFGAVSCNSYGRVDVPVRVFYDGDEAA